MQRTHLKSTFVNNVNTECAVSREKTQDKSRKVYDVNIEHSPNGDTSSDRLRALQIRLDQENEAFASQNVQITLQWRVSIALHCIGESPINGTLGADVKEETAAQNQIFPGFAAHQSLLTRQLWKRLSCMMWTLQHTGVAAVERRWPLCLL